jgi:hypothetical protein
VRLFPKLKEIEFAITELDTTAARCMHIAAAMTSPTIKEITFRIGHISDTASAHFNQQFFRALRNRCTGLTTIVMRLPTGTEAHVRDAAKGIEYALVGGSSQLRQVRLSRDTEPLDSMLLERLAGLSELRCLDLGAPLLDSPDVPSLKAGNFSKLDVLRLEDASQNAQLIRAILAQATRLRDLKLRTHCKEKVVALLSCVARDIGACTSLTRLRWRFSLSNDIPTSVDIVSVCWTIYEPLQSLASLELLHISCPYPLQLSDTQVLDLLSYWPRLRSWIHKNYADPESRTVVSLRTLLDGLVRCPFVEELPLSLSDLTLPDEATLVKLEALRHPFQHVLSMTEEDSGDTLTQTLRRVLPRTFNRQEMITHMLRSSGA